MLLFKTKSWKHVDLRLQQCPHYSPSLLCFQVKTFSSPGSSFCTTSSLIPCWKQMKSSVTVLTGCACAYPSSYKATGAFFEFLFHPQDDAVPARMILKSALTLLLLMASRQAEITWFLGLPTELKDGERQINECTQTPGSTNIYCKMWFVADNHWCISSLLHKVSFIVKRL